MHKLGIKPLWLMAIPALLMAADPPWIAKLLDQWTEEDARQVLTTSPWVKEVIAGITRRLTEDELRDGGEMGQHHGVGYDGVDPKGSGPKLTPNILIGGDNRSARSFPRATTLMVRWESALPVRAAEFKAREIEPPSSEGDGYRIAVYGVPGANLKGDPIQLGNPLKKEAALKRDGKKDVKPSRVEVFQRADDLVIVYLFPLSAEITKRDGRVEFAARIGRIVVLQSFDLAEMMFLGNLEI
ncbi:MAG: hypothetical protein ACLQU1_37380 [Bryobacteraceae bacterium]